MSLLVETNCSVVKHFVIEVKLSLAFPLQSAQVPILQSQLNKTVVLLIFLYNIGEIYTLYSTHLTNYCKTQQSHKLSKRFETSQILILC